MKNIIQNNEGITLVSLAVTVIVLIILAGVSINFVLGENGILTMAKKAKENIELAQIEEKTRLNELYANLEDEAGETGVEISYDAIAKLNDFKKKVADYIEEAGGIKPEYTANTETFGQRIKGIVAEVTKDATATAGDIAQGKTAWINGEKITGTGTNLSNLYYLGKIDNTYGFNIKSVTKTFNVSSISGYQSFTINNFICEGGAMCDTSASRQMDSSSISKSYNASTGILTVTSNVKVIVTTYTCGNIAVAPTNIPVYLYTGNIINMN